MIMSSSCLCCFPALTLALVHSMIEREPTCFKNFVQAAIVIMYASYGYKLPEYNGRRDRNPQSQSIVSLSGLVVSLCD